MLVPQRGLTLLPRVAQREDGTEAWEGKLGDIAGAWAQASVIINSKSHEISLISRKMFL